MISYLPSSLVEPYKPNVASGFISYKGDSAFVIKNIMLKYTWSPIVFKNAYRHEKNFESCEYIALDFDEGVTIAEIAKKYADTWHIIGTTRTHQQWKSDKPPCDRFRLLLKASCVCEDLRAYKHTMSYFIKNQKADGKCFDGARLFFPCKQIVSEFYEEDCYYEVWKEPPPIEEVQARQREAIERAKFQASSYKGAVSRYALRWLMNEIPQGERSDTVWKLGKELCMCGMQYEEALSRILASPTYKDSVVSPDTMKKIRSQLRSGYDQVQKTWGPKTPAS